MITREVNGFKMFLDPTDGGISKALANKGAREPCFMWILRKIAGMRLGRLSLLMPKVINSTDG